MRKTGLFFVLIFLLSMLGTHPVSAQDSDYGYIPLIQNNYDRSISREYQTRSNFEHIRYLLIRAKNMGQIEDFWPSFFGGFVTVSHPNIAILEDSYGLSVRRTMNEVFIKPDKTELRGLNRTASFTSWIPLYDRCVYILGAPADSRIKGSLQTSTGVMVGALDGFADSNGEFSNCFLGSKPYAVPGYKLTYKTFDSIGNLLNTYSTIIPNSTVNSLNMDTGASTGKSVPGKWVWLDWQHRLQDAANSDTYKEVDGTANTDGSWNLSYEEPLWGAGFISFGVEKNTYFRFNVNINLSHVFCVENTNMCYLAGLPKKSVNVTITHAGKDYLFTGKTDRYGYFDIELEDTNGNPILLVAGDKIAGTGVKTETLPKMTVTIYRSTDLIKGIAPKSKYFYVGFRRWDTYDGYQNWTGSSSTGTYSSDFTWTDIPANGPVSAWVEYTNPISGNTTIYEAVFP